MTPDHQNALHPVKLTVGGLTLEGFSISGIATWLHVAELDVLFDVGECPLSAVPVEHVFLTHAHGDHSRCLLRHWQLRRMFRQTEASYYIPMSAVDGYMKIVRAEAEMEGQPSDATVEYPTFKVLSDERVPFKKGLWVRAFPVKHRAPSQGFTIGRTVQKLKPEYASLTGPEIGQLRKAGTVVSDSLHTPIITFIGDCEGVSLTEQSHIWDSKVVVIECTYVEPEDAQLAAHHGHTHLDEIVEVLSRTPAPACEGLVLKHFSLKHDPKRVRELVASRIPAEWADRVHILLPVEG